MMEGLLAIFIYLASVFGGGAVHYEDGSHDIWFRTSAVRECRAIFPAFDSPGDRIIITCVTTK